MIVKDFDPTTQLRVTMPMSVRNEVEVNGNLYYIPEWAYRVFMVLLLSRGRMLSRNDIISAVWSNPDEEPDSSVRILHRAISELRKFDIPIQTWHGQGWRIPLPIKR